jgi:hypothetical protein
MQPKRQLAVSSLQGRAFSLQARLAGVAEADQLAVALGAEPKRRTDSDGLDILVNNIGGGDYGPLGRRVLPRAKPMPMSSMMRRHPAVSSMRPR